MAYTINDIFKRKKERLLIKSVCQNAISLADLRTTLLKMSLTGPKYQK